MLEQSTRSSRKLPVGGDCYRETSRQRHERIMDRMARLDLHRDAEQQSIMLRLAHRNLSKERADANWGRSQRRQVASKNRYFHRNHMDRLPDTYDPSEEASSNLAWEAVEDLLTDDEFCILCEIVLNDTPKTSVANSLHISRRALNRRLTLIMRKLYAVVP